MIGVCGFMTRDWNMNYFELHRYLKKLYLYVNVISYICVFFYK